MKNSKTGRAETITKIITRKNEAHNLFKLARAKVEMYKMGIISKEEAIDAIFDRLAILDRSDEYYECRDFLSVFECS